MRIRVAGAGGLVTKTDENDYEDTITRHEYEHEHAYEYEARRYDYDVAMLGLCRNSDDGWDGLHR
jgi:hypothetical protein